MKKIFALFVLCLLLSGCVDVTLTPESSPGEPTVTTESPSPELHTPDISPMPSVNPSPSEEPFVLNTDFVFDIPEPLDYTPEVKVFPLDSAWGYYKTHVWGSVSFVDETLSIVSLPFEPVDYAPIGVWLDGIPKAYAIGLPRSHPEYDGRDWVLMLTDGTVPRGEDGKYVFLPDQTHNEVSFTVTGSAVVTYESVNGVYHDAEGRQIEENFRYGLFDLDERRDVLPREYEMYLWDYPFTIEDAMLYGRKDGRGYLLSSKGEVLHDYGEVPDVYLDEEEFLWNREYGLFSYEGKKYTFIDGRFSRVYICKDMLIACHGAQHTIFDRAGQELFRTDSQEEAFAYAGISEPTQRYEENELYRQFTEGGPLYRDNKTNDTVLLDESGNVLLRTKDRMQVAGDFVLRYEPVGDMRSDPKTVYSFDGKVLLDNVYGWINEVLAPGGGLFVYLDPETCVLLMPDGSTNSVPAAPVVEKFYVG